MKIVQDFQMQVKDVFRFADGRSVFLGVVEGNAGYIPHALVELWQDGERRSGVFRIEGEMLSDQAPASGENPLRAVSTSTTELAFLDREMFMKGRWMLKSASVREGEGSDAQALARTR